MFFFLFLFPVVITIGVVAGSLAAATLALDIVAGHCMPLTGYQKVTIFGPSIFLQKNFSPIRAEMLQLSLFYINEFPLLLNIHKFTFHKCAI
jgi:hypothetical protein